MRPSDLSEGDTRSFSTCDKNPLVNSASSASSRSVIPSSLRRRRSAAPTLMFEASLNGFQWLGEFAHCYTHEPNGIVPASGRLLPRSRVIDRSRRS